MTRLALPVLYAIVDPLDTGRSPIELAAALLAGGARLLQLRLKAASSRDLLEGARAIKPLVDRTGGRLIVNDRPDVARAAGADGVHLGQDDLPVPAARAVLGPGAIVGVSTHAVEQARAAAAAGADYVGVGPVFATRTKAAALDPRGLELIRAVRAAIALPMVGIGGITPETAPAVIRAGADAVAMIAALVRAPDVSAAVHATLGRLEPWSGATRARPRASRPRE